MHPHACRRRRAGGSADARRNAGAHPLSALDVLQRDAVMARLIEEIGPLSVGQRKRGRPDDAYGTLVRSITGQQLSTKAAATIYGRLTERFGGRTPPPPEILDTSPHELRGPGLSNAKAAYLPAPPHHNSHGGLPVHHL